MTNRLERDGWADTLWLETSADDPGRGMTKEAVAAQVDLVIGAGCDGTVRVVADGLAGSGIPMGLVPAGTANLLARNLDLPLEQDAAVEIAFAGHTRTIDLIKLTVDDHPPLFAVIAGIGVDAMIMDETDSGLKDEIGSAAYFLAAANALGRTPIRLTVQLDHHRPVKRRAMICAIANVGKLAGNVTLIPQAAVPDDGLLNLYVASPHRLRDWVKLGLRLISRRPQKDDQVDQHSGKVVRVRIHGKDS